MTWSNNAKDTVDEVIGANLLPMGVTKCTHHYQDIKSLLTHAQQLFDLQLAIWLATTATTVASSWAGTCSLPGQAYQHVLLVSCLKDYFTSLQRW